MADVHSLIDKDTSKAERIGSKLIDKGVAKGNKLNDPVWPETKPEKRKRKTTHKGEKKRKAGKQKLTNILKFSDRINEIADQTAYNWKPAGYVFC